MLVGLEIENFFSVHEAVVLRLPVAANVPDDEGRFVQSAGLRIPKVTLLYGPNASGKTTILRSLALLQWFLRASFRAAPGERLPFAPFRGEGAVHTPTRLRVDFTGDLGAGFETLCSYRLDIAHGEDGSNAVLREALSHAPSGRMRRLFERHGGTIRGSEEFELADRDPRIDSVRPNASVVSTFAQLNHGPSMRIVDALDGMVANLALFRFAPGLEDVVATYAQRTGSLDRLNDVLPRLDVGIRGARLVPGERGPVVLFEHEGLAGALPLAFESGGTQQFFRLFPLIDRVLEVGGLALIDELDAELHPTLLPEIIRWFHSPVRNTHNAQLVATCHNPYLLEHLDKTEIWFTEKRSSGATSLFGLRDVQGIRRSDNFYRKYMDGALGALPNLG